MPGLRGTNLACVLGALRSQGYACVVQLAWAELLDLFLCCFLHVGNAHQSGIQAAHAGKK